MKNLCIETCSQVGHVVLAEDERIIGASVLVDQSRHAETLLPQIDELLRQHGVQPAELKLIGVSVGPGGFSSLRAGLATAKGLAFASNTPIVGVVSLAVLARVFSIDGVASVPVINAYRGDIYAAAYLQDGDALQTLCAPLHGAPSRVVNTLLTTIGEQPAVVGGDSIQCRAAFPNADHITITELSANRPQQRRLQALVSEVVAQYNARGADDLAALQACYLRASDAKLPVFRPT